jgi:hypothetical protein
MAEELWDYVNTVYRGEEEEEEKRRKKKKKKQRPCLHQDFELVTENSLRKQTGNVQNNYERKWTYFSVDH